MRPGDFSPGNTHYYNGTSMRRGRSRFNEAGGFLPRKLGPDQWSLEEHPRGFNEAGGFLPRKHQRYEEEQPRRTNWLQ